MILPLPPAIEAAPYTPAVEPFLRKPSGSLIGKDVILSLQSQFKKGAPWVV